MSRDIKGYQGGRRIFRKLHSVLRNLKGLLGAYLMRVWLISVFKLVLTMGQFGLMIMPWPFFTDFWPIFWLT